MAGGEVRRQRRNGEQARRERSPDAGHAVHGDRADRVVDPDPLDPEHADDGDHARDRADHDRGPRGDEALTPR